MDGWMDLSPTRTCIGGSPPRMGNLGSRGGLVAAPPSRRTARNSRSNGPGPVRHDSTRCLLSRSMDASVVLRTSSRHDSTRLGSTGVRVDTIRPVGWSKTPSDAIGRFSMLSRYSLTPTSPKIVLDIACVHDFPSPLRALSLSLSVESRSLPQTSRESSIARKNEKLYSSCFTGR